MRIVIEIEEERYNYVKNQVKGGIDNPLKVIIANGIPLTTVKPQPCTDAVSRQAVLEYIEGSEADLWHDSENDLVRQDIRELPSVEPKQKMGRWIVHRGYNADGFGVEYSCSKCNEWVNEKSKYCPNCGQPKIQEAEE